MCERVSHARSCSHKQLCPPQGHLRQHSNLVPSTGGPTTGGLFLLPQNCFTFLPHPNHFVVSFHHSLQLQGRDPSMRLRRDSQSDGSRDTQPFATLHTHLVINICLLTSQRDASYMPQGRWPSCLATVTPSPMPGSTPGEVGGESQGPASPGSAGWRLWGCWQWDLAVKLTPPCSS